MVMDENHVILIDPATENIGENFFDDEIQQQIINPSFVNDHVQSILEGKMSTVIFALNDDIGERISTGIPVTVNKKIQFIFAVVTPTQSINNEIDEIIFVTKIQTIFFVVVHNSRFVSILS